MANNQIPNIYKAAIERYEEITRKKLDDPSLLKLTSVEGLIQTIESDNAKFESFRAKRHGIFAALASAMRPIELLGDLAAGAAEMAFEPSALVFGAISLLIHAAKDVSASYDAILDVMEMLKVGPISLVKGKMPRPFLRSTLGSMRGTILSQSHIQELWGLRVLSYAILTHKSCLARS